MEKNTLQEIRDIQHFGEEGGVVPVIDHAATSTFLDPGEMEKVFLGEREGCYLYSRHTNPSVIALGKKMAAMEGTEAAFGVASGMAAISCTVEQILLEGGHMVTSNTIYGGTYALFKNVLPKRGVEITFVDPFDIEAFEKAIRPDTKLIYTEVMSNPLLGISDISALSKITKKHGIKLVVDNTFTPLMVKPKELGADVVIHSATKFISGHSDLIAGVICSDQDFINQLIDVNMGLAMLYGPVMDPKVAYELYVRLDHLPIRIQAHSNAARSLVEYLMKKEVKGVIYPGLETHPQYEVFQNIKKDGYGDGGMITLDCGNLENALRLAHKLQDAKFGLFAVSLGFSRTLMSCPSASTSSEIPKDEQDKIGLREGLLRLSIGYTGDLNVMNERFWNCYQEVMS
jgi:methionine-gamma-lyase